MKRRYDLKWFVYGLVYRQENFLEDCPKGPDLREAIMGMEEQE